MIKRSKLVLKRVCAAVLAAAVLCMIPVSNVNAVGASGAISKGIDVSKHNGGINWSQVAASGIKFTFIKVGSTNSGIDPQFAANITGAQAAGLRTGVYIYSYATTPEQAANEANLVLQWIEPYTVNFPIVFDIEDKCHKNLSNQQLIDIVNAFCTVIDSAGYYPMVYSYKSMFTSKLSNVGWDKWVAQYNDNCDYNNNVCFWQYTSSGSVGGIGGRVDLNYQYKDYNSLIIPEGFIGHNGSVRFYRNWRMQRGWVAYNDTRYYLDGAGNLVSGWFTDPSGTYYLSPQDGSIARGQVQVDGADYYFTAEGVKTSGWVTLNDMKYFYEPSNNGIMKRGWLSDEKANFYYFDPKDGHMLTGGQVIDKAEYLFNGEGIRQHGWVTLENGVFYYDPSTGAKVRGFMDDAKGRHYLSPDDGHMVTGAAVIDKKNYFFSPEGVMMTGMVAREDGSYYYDPATGQMVTGWFTANDQTYYADQAGHVVTGVYEIDKQPYYFNEAGILMRNQAVEINGVSYTTTPEGILVEVEAALAGEG
ncbi:MAG: GH25 family lysozyme [Lachnospiraceae bacterium]|nr:GH25 family lysozyme [Lachnospiraceae bacterium]